jgi:phosphatidylserine decarboxylase
MLLQVSPADGTLQRCGTLSDNYVIEQVKGIDYSLAEFFGPDITPPSTSQLHYVCIYLAPGDYHGFHSPADWTIYQRRHINGVCKNAADVTLLAGTLLSVRLGLIHKVSKLFVLNERVALLGRWPHGFMSMTAVGATNVGNIVIDNVCARVVQLRTTSSV